MQQPAQPLPHQQQMLMQPEMQGKGGQHLPQGGYMQVGYGPPSPAHGQSYLPQPRPPDPAQVAQLLQQGVQAGAQAAAQLMQQEQRLAQQAQALQQQLQMLQQSE